MEHILYLEISYKSRSYHLFRLENTLFLRHITTENENDRTVPHIKTKTKKDIVIPFSEIKRLTVCGDVHYDENGKKTEYFFGEIIVYTNDKPKTMEVFGEITEADIFEFFADTPFSVSKKAPQKPKTDKKENAYRKQMREKRNPVIQKAISIYFFALIGYLFVAIFLAIKHLETMLLISISLFLINFILVLALPAYFSVYQPGKKEHREEIGIPVFLWIPTSSMSISVLFGGNNVTGRLLPTIIFAFLITAIIFFRYLREVKFLKAGAIVFLIFAFLISADITVAVANQTAKDNLVFSQSAEVVHYRKEKRGKRSYRYIITVEMPDGSEESYSIPSSMYQSKDAGDTVYLETYEGIFGISFTYVRNSPSP